MKDLYATWKNAEKSMLKHDGKITEFSKELALQPLRVHEIHKKGLEEKTVFVHSLQRFTRLFNTYIQINRLTIRRRKMMRAKEEKDLAESNASLNAYCKSNGDSKFANINGYILLYTQGAKYDTKR